MAGSLLRDMRTMAGLLGRSAVLVARNWRKLARLFRYRDEMRQLALDMNNCPDCSDGLDNACFEHEAARGRVFVAVMTGAELYGIPLPDTPDETDTDADTGGDPAHRGFE